MAIVQVLLVIFCYVIFRLIDWLHYAFDVCPQSSRAFSACYLLLVSTSAEIIIKTAEDVDFDDLKVNFVKFGLSFCSTNLHVLATVATEKL